MHFILPSQQHHSTEGLTILLPLLLVSGLTTMFSGDHFRLGSEPEDLPKMNLWELLLWDYYRHDDLPVSQLMMSMH